MELVPSSVRLYAHAIDRNDFRAFRTIRSWREWKTSEMSLLLDFLIKNDEVDAYKNNYEIGFVLGNSGVPTGSLIFCPDMKHYTTEVCGMRSRYKFDGGKLKCEPENCWFLTYRNLNTQCFATYRLIADTTQDNLLRDNNECPVCLEPLTGLLFKCPAEHQVCQNCFHNLVSPKKCPICRAKYDMEQLIKYETARRNRDLISRDIRFGGKNYQRELKLCGFLKDLFIRSGHDATLIYAGMFYYLNETHLPLLENKGEYSQFKIEMLDNPAWTAFFSYLISDSFHEKLYSSIKTYPVTNAKLYPETEYLLHLAEKYGADAHNQTVEISRDETLTKRFESRFKMYFEFVFRKKPVDYFKRNLENTIAKCFDKYHNHSYKQHELIEHVEPPL
jgi:hypothetical protein